MTRALVALGIALALGGCPDVENDCTQVESATTADVRVSFCGKHPTFNRVRVVREGGGPDLWSLRPIGGPEAGKPLGELRYGVVPDGWSEAGQKPTLRRGDRIEFVASGPGHHGGVTVIVE